MDPSRAKIVAHELQISRSSVSSPVCFHGTSMEPLFVEGDQLVIEHIDWEQIVPGDIVTYRFEDKFPTRRVIEKRSDSLVLSCDNWPMERFQTHRDEILGRAVGRRRDGSWLWTGEDEWRRARLRALRRAKLEAPVLAVRALRRVLTRFRHRISRPAA
jgi:hypothetical protein